MKEIKYKSKGNYENIILAEQIKEENEFIIIFKEEKTIKINKKSIIYIKEISL